MRNAKKETHEHKNIPETRIGKRMTRARKEIIQFLESCKVPTTIKEMTAHTTSNEASVYRTVKLLLDEGLLHEIHYPSGAHRYELERVHHDHVICTACGFTAHIPCSVSPHTPSSVPDFSTMTHHEVTYFGLCTKCA